MKNKIGFIGVLFVIIGLLTFMVSCATAPPAEEKKAAPPPKKEQAAEAREDTAAAVAAMKWTSEKDGVAKEGTFTRTAAPAFTFDYPTSWVMDPLQGTDVFRGKNPGGLPVVNVTVDRITAGMDPKEYLQGYAAGYAKVLETLGTNVEILKNEPTDKYAPYPGQEIEIEWAYGGSTYLVSFVKAVVKDGYVIGMGGHTMGDPGGLDTIFDSIDLEP